MKKLFPIFIVVVLGFNLAACSDEEHGYGTKVSKKEWKEKGVIVDGKIDKKYKKKFRTQEGTKRTYYILYKFEPLGSKEQVKGKFKVKESIWEQTQRGEPIEIQYLKDDPETNRLTLAEF